MWRRRYTATLTTTSWHEPRHSAILEVRDANGSSSGFRLPGWNLGAQAQIPVPMRRPKGAATVYKTVADRHRRIQRFLNRCGTWCRISSARARTIDQASLSVLRRKPKDSISGLPTIHPEPRPSLPTSVCRYQSDRRTDSFRDVYRQLALNSWFSRRLVNRPPKLASWTPVWAPELTLRKG
jgi:hypothetical protein